MDLEAEGSCEVWVLQGVDYPRQPKDLFTKGCCDLYSILVVHFLYKKIPQRKPRRSALVSQLKAVASEATLHVPKTKPLDIVDEIFAHVTSDRTVYVALFVEDFRDGVKELYASRPLTPEMFIMVHMSSWMKTFAINCII